MSTTVRSLRIEDDLWAQLDVDAKREGVSRNALIAQRLGPPSVSAALDTLGVLQQWDEATAFVEAVDAEQSKPHPQDADRLWWSCRDCSYGSNSEAMAAHHSMDEGHLLHGAVMAKDAFPDLDPEPGPEPGPQEEAWWDVDRPTLALLADLLRHGEQLGLDVRVQVRRAVR